MRGAILHSPIRLHGQLYFYGYKVFVRKPMVRAQLEDKYEDEQSGSREETVWM
jgi:CRISPR/Cas system CSM-associated protein Csm4 (group 5 of RAMP superfamily)